MHDLIELLDGWYGDVRKLETDRLMQLLSLGAKVQKVLELKDRLDPRPGRKRAVTPSIEPRAASPDIEMGV